MQQTRGARPTGVAVAVAVAAVCVVLAMIAMPVAAEQTKVSQLFSSLFANPDRPYDNQLRPGLNTTKPVIINTALRINLLYNVDSKEETFQLDLFVNEYWSDPRLAFDASEWATSDALRIPSRYVPWQPDTFFFNAIKCLPLSDSSLTLSPDGTVFWSRHQSCTFHTSLNLLEFPFDKQTLAVRRTSFSYTDDELKLRFLTPTGWRPDPQVDFTNSLWDFDFAFSNISSLVFINTHSANTYLTVSRRSANYILKMILPLFLLVLLSSLGYAVDPGSPPARVGFSVSLVLSIVTFNLVVSQDLPKINYATLLDWYVWCCFMFVVLALAEYAVVNSLVVSKKFGPAIPFLVDDFAMWTMPQSWIVFNLCYWPIYNSVGLTLCLVVAWSAWMLLNVVRVRWNHVNEKRGLWEPTKHLYWYIRAHWKRNDGDLAALQAHTAAEDEAADAAAADTAIRMAEATGANVFELHNSPQQQLQQQQQQAVPDEEFIDEPSAAAAAAAAAAAVAAEYEQLRAHDSALGGGGTDRDDPNPFDGETMFDDPHASSSAAYDDDDDPYYDEQQAQGGYAVPHDEEYDEQERVHGQGAADLNLV